MLAENQRLPSSIRVIKAIGWITFTEIIRDKILYNIILCSILVMGAGILVSKLTFIQPERIVLDMGLSAIALSCGAIAIFTSAGLLGKEFERRTIYVTLSRPISRLQFMIGKFFGMALILSLNWLLLFTIYLLNLFASQGGDLISPTLIMASTLIFFQSLILVCVTLLISTISTTSLSAVIGVGFYLLGNSVTYIKLIASKSSYTFVKGMLNAIAFLIPNLEYFNLGNKSTYGLPVSVNYFVLSILYSFFVISVLLLLSGFLLQNREV